MLLAILTIYCNANARQQHVDLMDMTNIFTLFQLLAKEHMIKNKPIEKITLLLQVN